MLHGHDVSSLLKEAGRVCVTKLVQGRVAHFSPSCYSLQPTEHFIAPEAVSFLNRKIPSPPLSAGL